MTILNLLLIIGVLALLVAGIFWGGLVFAVAISLIWGLLPIIVGVIGIAIGVMLWHAGYDNLGVLASLGVFAAMGVFRHFICGGTDWDEWSRKRDPGDWLGQRWEGLFKSLRLVSRQPLLECPKCGSRRFSKRVASSHSYDTTTSETRRIQHFAPDGTEAGYSEVEEEVPATVTTTTYFCRCEKCSHTWEA